MKIATKLTRLLAFLGIIWLAAGCATEEVQPANEQNLQELTVNDENLKIFNEAITITNFSTDKNLRSNGYTIFAPSNEAFRTFLSENGFNNLSEVPRSVLLNILGNHFVSGRYLASDLRTGYLKTFAKGTASSSNTLSLFVNTSNGVKLNGVSSVIRANINVGNNVVHIVNKVIPLPTIVTHAVANPNFTSLVGALTSPGQPNFVGILSGNGPFTVFAPLNSAFIALDEELQPGGIASVSASNLTKVLTYHVANGNVLSSSLSNGLVVPTLLGQNFTINLSPARITDANGRVSNIVAVDVQCTNGVIHVLDKVLLPSL